MRKTFLALLLSLFSVGAYCQDSKVINLISNEVYQLNGGLRSQFGGRSRIAIPISLPYNTRGLVYTIQAYRQGESVEHSLNLGMSLLTLINTGNVTLANAVSNIEIPASTQTVDVYLLPGWNDKENFVNKREGYWRIYDNASRTACSNCKVALENVAGMPQNLFLGLRNLSSLDAITIVVNVAAVTY